MKLQIRNKNHLRKIVFHYLIEKSQNSQGGTAAPSLRRCSAQVGRYVLQRPGCYLDNPGSVRRPSVWCIVLQKVECFFLVFMISFDPIVSFESKIFCTHIVKLQIFFPSNSGIVVQDQKVLFLLYALI